MIRIINKCNLGIFNKILRVSSILGLYQLKRYSIESVAPESGVVVIRCCGTRSIIRMLLSDAVCDMELLGGLTAIQASYIGGYYGRILRQSAVKDKAFKKAKKMTCLLKCERGVYRISYLNRNSEVGYIDGKTGNEYVESPLVIVNNHHILKQFDSSQACYIGILAGISMERQLSLSCRQVPCTNKPPALRAVS